MLMRYYCIVAITYFFLLKMNTQLTKKADDIFLRLDE
jgi:hypothetical protein